MVQITRRRGAFNFQRLVFLPRRDLRVCGCCVYAKGEPNLLALGNCYSGYHASRSKLGQPAGGAFYSVKDIGPALCRVLPHVVSSSSGRQITLGRKKKNGKIV